MKASRNTLSKLDAIHSNSERIIYATVHSTDTRNARRQKCSLFSSPYEIFAKQKPRSFGRGLMFFVQYSSYIIQFNCASMTSLGYFIIVLKYAIDELSILRVPCSQFLNVLMGMPKDFENRLCVM